MTSSILQKQRSETNRYSSPKTPYFFIPIIETLVDN